VARVKKRYERRRVVEVLREVVRGAEGAVQERLMETRALFNGAHQHRLCRALERHISRPAGAFGEAHPCRRA
jgi:hypothetical protein